ncbi:DNA polymerase III subunit delta' [Aliiglaciecola lipolytica]|uniref:DNA-directed DNA polymerase n=1 Tax=Aliiglaciecola lipolytica E3 TaxID=1127673 RepID=K6Y9I9_9ALTE|nr:DNA polymerase III subunit delta' [Aliiglaciecola lipolytica]GAC14842.1 DNA polymerase III subunit delta' [Aliiglaciecola lipolytica E3]
MYPWLNGTFRQLAQRAQRNSLHHALLVQGPSGIGKTFFCDALTKSLLCKKQENEPCGTCQSCQLFNAQSHPDLHRIASDKQLGVDLVREAIQKLTSTAHLSGNKVLIIERADSMTESAANALLKTLEEPTGDTYLFLISAHPERLLPTIISRCEKVNISAPSFDECKQWLSSQNIAGVTDDIIRIYGHCPLTIISQLENQQSTNYADFCHSMEEMKRGKMSALVLAEKWQKESDQIVLWLQYELRQIAAANIHNSLFWQIENKLKLATVSLQNPGVNRILVLTGLLLDYQKL